MRPIAISLSPNTFSRDLRLATRILLQPWGWLQAEEDSKSYFRDWLLFDSGRSALLGLLKAFGIGPTDEVLLQAFTCVAVPNPVLWSGAKPVYVDIEPDTLNMSVSDLERKITRRSKAVIVQHTFGLPAAMDRIREVAKAQDLIVIEDLAHALGAKYKGREVGTLGDAAFFSFGRDKIVSSVAGGAAVISPRLTAQNSKLKEDYQRLEYPPKSWVLQQLLHPLLSEAVLATYSIGLGKLLHFALQTLGVLSRANTKEEKELAQKPFWVPAKMPRALQLLMQEQIRRLEVFNRRRGEIAKRYLTFGLKSAQPNMPGRVWLRFPLIVRSPADLHLLAKEYGIFLGDWYDQVIAPEGVNLAAVGYEKGMCQTAEEISGRIINLPTYPKMTAIEAEKVIELVKEGLEKKGILL